MKVSQFFSSMSERLWRALRAFVMTEEPDLYSRLWSADQIIEGQYWGLGLTRVPPASMSPDGKLVPGHARLVSQVNRTCWVTEVSLKTATEFQTLVLVSHMGLAGLPFDVASEGAPINNFDHYYIPRRLALVGQALAVDLLNYGSCEALVSGGASVDEPRQMLHLVEGAR